MALYLSRQRGLRRFTAMRTGHRVALILDYIQMYAGNAALLAESLEVIQRTSAVILDAITKEPATTQNAPSASSPEVQDAIAEVA